MQVSEILEESGSNARKELKTLVEIQEVDDFSVGGALRRKRI